jgi:hypothetical protein
LDVPPPSNSLFIHHQGVIHPATADGSVANVHYYVHDVGLWPIVTNWLQSNFGFDQFAFTPYSSPHAWTTTIPDAPLTNILTSQAFLQEVMEQSHHKPAGEQPPPTGDQQQQQQLEPPALFSPPGIIRQQRHRPDPHAVPITPGTATHQPSSAASPAAPAPAGITGLLQTIAQNFGGLVPLVIIRVWSHTRGHDRSPPKIDYKSRSLSVS